MPFCMEVITRTLKDVAFCDLKNDRALGQLLVLLQYQWPKEEEIFASLITTVQKRRRFYFPEFFDYVIRIHTFSFWSIHTGKWSAMIVYDYYFSLIHIFNP